jgi:hypothetical protein
MLDRVYGHHHPDHLRAAARALGYGRRRQSLAETLAGRHARRPASPQRTEIAGGPGRTRTSNQTVMSAITSSEVPIKSDFCRHTNQRMFTIGCGQSLAKRWLGRGAASAGRVPCVA